MEQIVSGVQAGSTRYTAIKCRETCPKPKYVTDDLVINWRRSNWSDPASWSNGQVPQENDEVEIEWDREITLDVDPPKLAKLTIIGRLKFDPSRDNVLKSKLIWVFQGALLAGDSSTPFPNKIRIEL